MIQWHLYYHGTLHWQAQPCWSALSKNVIWSFIFRITAVFSCLISCGGFGGDTCWAFCRDRSGILLCEILGRTCSQSSRAPLEADTQAAPGGDPDPTQAAQPLKHCMDDPAGTLPYPRSSPHSSCGLPALLSRTHSSQPWWHSFAGC